MISIYTLLGESVADAMNEELPQVVVDEHVRCLRQDFETEREVIGYKLAFSQLEPDEDYMFIDEATAKSLYGDNVPASGELIYYMDGNIRIRPVW